jgi:ferredoxin
MTHVVSARCIDCRYTDCSEVCPVECFYEVEDPAMLVIDPETCIDCMACVPACPVNAIYSDAEVPEHYAEWVELNAALVPLGTQVSDNIGSLGSALDLDGVRAREEAAGWPSVEPGEAAH